ncbi:ribosome biogenesis GTPase Der [Acuticoccus sp. M5D2P5]|uniref:ribosome biogenesis GTPase Der n=1 Tax=Acuticoccus kalidii TaxID=2910977 RepID=UPI001F02F145|nr:ribosome biogenesis GTPase Der [Acuticoccus kalidii]MCF3935731.1 ribosome biogenesis GTPase Der [Acuticoccus kalidii]
MKVAIAGRANVGKSTLFNRLVGKRLAIVNDTPGVTRDRREADARLQDLAFTLIDTAGFEGADETTLEGRMWRQMTRALDDADIYLFVVDVRAGVTPLDEMLAADVRRRGKPVVLIANKAEGRTGDLASLEAYSLGLGDPIAFSAEHGEGLSDLRDALADAMEAVEADQALASVHEPVLDTEIDEETDGEIDTAAVDPARPIHVAIVGRPNVGKSTLLNTVIGEERMLTGPEAGLTRDAISVEFTSGDQRFKLVDTAGLRRRAKVVAPLERLSTADTIRALKYAEAVIVVLDATQPFERQDLSILDLVAREGRAIVIALNKWDLVRAPDETIRAAREAASRLVPQAAGVRVVPVSALSGRGVPKLMDTVREAVTRWSARISTGRLNRWLEMATQRHPPPAVGGRRIRIRYMTQAKTRPPTFIAFCSRPEVLPASYQRYLMNGIRETFDLPGVPIRLTLRKQDNPYAD